MYFEREAFDLHQKKLEIRGQPFAGFYAVEKLECFKAVQL